ncbi:MAG: NAD(P)/FAD-dependent oxidoreductase [Actinobacteria bacterium]|nr:NAD(P)/FAD-dependent oxidoreductase [Actinomycetota bacterium]
MQASEPLVTLTADAGDAVITAAVEDAYLPGLLAALAHATGDLSLLRPELRPDPNRMREPQGGLPPERIAEARALARDALIRFRDGGRVLAPAPGTEALRTMIAFVAGQPVTDDYLPLLREELAAGDEDLRAPAWNAHDLDPGRTFLVAIVGAGMSGLLAAHRLAQAGVPFVIIEKNDDVGGTWLENTYPGCRVDVPNHLYSYSFAQKDDWPERYTPQARLLEYFRDCADDLELRPHIRFGTEVTCGELDEERGTWTLHLRTRDGTEETLTANAVVSAVGQLNRPKLPDIPGIESFRGRSFHSARWDHDVDLTGKRVAVVGSAASAIQLLPIIAEQARELVVFQRTANWFAPVPEYHEAVSDGMRWLLTHVPYYSEWYRFCLFWVMVEGLTPAARVDPDWAVSERSVGELNELLRVLLTGYLESQFGEDPELLEKVVPNYPPLAKRPLLDNGSWAKTLKRDNVALVTDAIDAVTENGIRTRSGHEYEADVIVYATGFHASHFLTPMRMIGRGGRDLHEEWAGDAGAYLGITVPHFPNLFCLYGPNTNIVANGSIIFFSECGARYVLGCIRLLFERRRRALDVKPDVYEAFRRQVDEGNSRMAWGVSSVNSWYKNDSGRITQNWPFSLLDYWQRTLAPDPAEYEFL